MEWPWPRRNLLTTGLSNERPFLIRDMTPDEIEDVKGMTRMLFYTYEDWDRLIEADKKVGVPNEFIEQLKTFIPKYKLGKDKILNTDNLINPNMIKNDPYKVLKEAGIAKSALTERGVKALEFFDRAKKLHEQNPKAENIQEQAERVGEKAIAEIKKEIDRLKSQVKNEEEEKEKQVVKKTQSKQLVEKTKKIVTDLDECREKLKEDRKKKMASGEIKPPKKKTVTTRIREELLRIPNMIPKALEKNPDVLQKTQRAILRFLNELKEIWGLNKIKSIQEEIKEKFEKLTEQQIREHVVKPKKKTEIN